MIRILGLSISFIVTHVLLSTTAYAQTCTDLQQLNWLLGDWQQTKTNSLTTESWTVVSEQSLEGSGHSFKLVNGEKQLSSTESMRILQMGGEIFFIAKVAHNELPVVFKAIDCTANSVAFINAEHDFPNKLHYQRQAEQLNVDVSDMAGKGFKVVFSAQAKQHPPTPTFSKTGHSHNQSAKQVQPMDWGPSKANFLFSSNYQGNSEIYIKLAKTGELKNLTNTPNISENWPRWSPDGTRILYQSNANGKLDVWQMHADGSNKTQLTEDPAHDYLAAFNHNGEQITFASWRSVTDREVNNSVDNRSEGKVHLYQMKRDGSQLKALLSESPNTSTGAEWAPDGSGFVIARSQSSDSSSSAIYWYQADGSGEKQLTDDNCYHGTPSFSPDSKTIAYYCASGPGSDIWLMSIDGSNKRQLTNSGQNWYPRFSPDGKWLTYTLERGTNGQSNLDIVAVQLVPGAKPITLIATEGRDSEGAWQPLATH
jgi:Tol biopolymer transport system component